MPSKTEVAGPSQSYQRFAWVTLGLAGMVALFSADRNDPGAAAGASPPALAAEAPVPAKMAQATFTQPAPAPLADAESVEDGDQLAGDTGDEQPGATASPGSNPALAGNGADVPAAGPGSPAEAGQLLSSSRGRSGGINQGDETVRSATAP